MIDTKPSKTHEKNIKQHKSLLEKWDMWDFAYFDGRDYYFLTQFEQILKGITGYLILDYKGNIVPFEEAKAPALALVSFNTMIHSAMKEMVPQMLKDMSPYRDLVSLINRHKADLVRIQPNLEASIEKIITHTTYALGNSKRIDDIINTLGNLQRFATRKHGYFDDAILNDMQAESVKYNVMMYDYGLQEFELMDDYQQVINVLSEGTSNVPLSARKKISDLLRASIQSNNGALKKTMRGFVEGFAEENIKLDESNLQQSFDEKMTKSGLKAFEEKIVPKIRNPK